MVNFQVFLFNLFITALWCAMIALVVFTTIYPFLLRHYHKRNTHQSLGQDIEFIEVGKVIGDYPQQVIAADQLFNWFGYWPSFHDAEIIWIKLEREREILHGDVTIEFLVNTWELVKENEQLKMNKCCLVHFAFKNCFDIKLDGFNHQNQLSTLGFLTKKQTLSKPELVLENAVVSTIDHQQNNSDKILKVVFIPEFGLDGGFKCYSGEILNITACDENGIALDKKA